jgi:hypothetical protein
VTFQSYGAGSATISSGTATGFNALNLPGVAISNLLFTGSGGAVDGIHIENNQAGNTKIGGPSLSGVTVSSYGGIGIHIAGTNGNSGFDVVTLTSCISHDNTSHGILVHGAGYQSGTPCNNTATATDCLVYNCGFHGLCLNETNTATMTRCVAHDCGALNNGTVGLFMVDDVNPTISFCEAYNIKTSGANDGDGFNIDANAGGTALIEYCYSHDNQGFGWLFDHYVGVNHATMRYCISQNNGTSARANLADVVMNVNQPTAGVVLTMHNCTIYSAYPAIAYAAAGVPISVFSGNIANNIFYSVGGAAFVGDPGAGATVGNPTSLIFNGNDYYASGAFHLYWNGTTYTSLAAWKAAFTNQETVNGGFTFDPLLVSPGGGGNLGGYFPLLLPQYKLRSGSPCVGTGINLNSQFSINPGSQDYYGFNIPHSVLTGYNVGASGSTPTLPVSISLTSGTPQTVTRVVG